MNRMFTPEDVVKEMPWSKRSTVETGRRAIAPQKGGGASEAFLHFLSPLNAGDMLENSRDR